MFKMLWWWAFLRVDTGTGSVILKSSLQHQTVLKSQFLSLETNILDISSHSFYSYIQKYTCFIIPNFFHPHAFYFDKINLWLLQFFVVVVPPTFYLGVTLVLSESSGCNRLYFLMLQLQSASVWLGCHTSVMIDSIHSAFIILFKLLW